MQIKELFSKIRNTSYLYIILIIGVAIMLLSGKRAEPEHPPSDTFAFSEEERLEEILSEIDGIGRVDVMVTYYTSQKKDLAFEKKTSQRTASQGSEKDEEKTVVLSDGSPFVLREIYPEVKGVIVLADGARDAQVRKSIHDAVVTAMDIAAHRVCILY